MEDVLTLLGQATQGNRGAQEKLEQYETSHFAMYLGQLIEKLGQENLNEETRMAIALQVKTILSGKEETSQRIKEEQWNSLDQQAKDVVKRTVLNVLATAPVKVSKQAAQCVEAVAKLEFENHMWVELPEQLVMAFDQVMQRDQTQIIGPLLALGYFANVAAHTDFDIQEQQVDVLLSKISIGMQTDKMPEDVQIAATGALADTLEFAKHNMEKDNERAMIMKMIFNMTESRFPGAREHAFQCLTTVLTMYYHLLPNHMNEIWEKTTVAIKNNGPENEGAAKQALNFWDELAFEETERSAAAEGQNPNEISIEDRNFGFIHKVSEPLCRIVVEYCLLQQPQEPDDDEKTEDTLYGFAEHCFVSLCACLKEQLIQYAMSFAAPNMVHLDWRYRQAAIFALGAVLQENPPHSLGNSVDGLILPLLRRMTSPDPSAGPVGENMAQHGEPVASVRETAAWAVSQICQSHLTALKPQHMQALCQVLLQSLKDLPRVAHMGATAIFCFAGAFIGEANNDTNTLGPNLMRTLAAALWEAANRDDSDEWHLMEDAYEALIRLIEASARDLQEFIGSTLLGHSLDRLAKIKNGTLPDPTRFREVELCAIVYVCCLKLDKSLLHCRMPGVQKGSPSDIPEHLPDKIVETMIQILQNPNSVAHPDAYQAVAEVCRIVEVHFKRYFEHVFPFVLRDMQNYTNAQTCIPCVRFCGDMCRALGPDINKVVRQLMELIYQNCKSNDCQRDVKPPHLTLIGDIANEIGKEKFEPYFFESMQLLLAAADSTLDITDEDGANDLNALRSAAIESMNYLVLDASEAELDPFLEKFYHLGQQISLEVLDPRNYYQKRDNRPSDLNDISLPYTVSPEVVKNILGVLADVSVKAKLKFTAPVKNEKSFNALFQFANQSEDPELVENADYARQCIDRVQ